MEYKVLANLKENCNERIKRSLICLPTMNNRKIQKKVEKLSKYKDVK